MDVAPAPLLDAALVRALRRRRRRHLVPGRRVRRRRPPRRRDQLSAHGWASAALTPYTLASGRAPTGAHEVVADARLAVGSRLRVATPAGEATYRVTGTVRGAAGPPTLFFADAVASRLSGHPGKVNAIAIPNLKGLSRLYVRDAAASDARPPEATAGTRRGAPTAARIGGDAAR